MKKVIMWGLFLGMCSYQMLFPSNTVGTGSTAGEKQRKVFHDGVYHFGEAPQANVFCRHGFYAPDSCSLNQVKSMSRGRFTDLPRDPVGNIFFQERVPVELIARAENANRERLLALRYAKVSDLCTERMIQGSFVRAAVDVKKEELDALNALDLASTEDGTGGNY